MNDKELYAIVKAFFPTSLIRSLGSNIVFLFYNNNVKGVRENLATTDEKQFLNMFGKVVLLFISLFQIQKLPILNKYWRFYLCFLQQILNQRRVEKRRKGRDERKGGGRAR